MKRQGIGELKERENLNRKRGEADRYHKGLLMIGGEIVPILATDTDLRRPIQRAQRQPEDVPGKSVLKQIKAVVKVALSCFLLAVLAGSQVGCTQTMGAGGKAAVDGITDRGGAVTMAEKAGVVKGGTASVGRQAADFLFGKSLINPIAPANGWKFSNEMRYIGTKPLEPNSVITRNQFRGYASFAVEYDPFDGVPFSAPIDLSLYAEGVKTAATAPAKAANWQDDGTIAAALEALVTAVDTNAVAP